jgi:hypothetical protein
MKTWQTQKILTRCYKERRDGLKPCDMSYKLSTLDTACKKLGLQPYINSFAGAVYFAMRGRAKIAECVFADAR